MEKLKNKHDHALTQWLKVIIFAILMMAPFFSILSRCLYVTCNKNAKDSYSDNYISRSLRITNSNSSLFTTGTQYLMYTKKATAGTGNAMSSYFTYTDASIDLKQHFNLSYDVNGLGFSTDANFAQYFRAYAYDKLLDSWNPLNNGGIIRYTESYWNTYFKDLSFTFTLDTFSTQNTMFSTPCAFALYYSANNGLDNAFEYSVNQLNETPIFNWVQNTAIYQPVNAMTNGLGFNANNNVMALLLTYWAILTAVYVLFDIIISCFVKITHLLSGNA